MKLNELKTPDFTRLIAELRTRARISDVAAVAIEELLAEECRMLNCYYWEEYYNELESARDAGYDAGYDVGHVEGYDAGYEDGFDIGYDAGYSESHSVV